MGARTIVKWCYGALVCCLILVGCGGKASSTSPSPTPIPLQRTLAYPGLTVNIPSGWVTQSDLSGDIDTIVASDNAKITVQTLEPTAGTIDLTIASIPDAEVTFSPDLLTSRNISSLAADMYGLPGGVSHVVFGGNHAASMLDGEAAGQTTITLEDTGQQDTNTLVACAHDGYLYFMEMDTPTTLAQTSARLFKEILATWKWTSQARTPNSSVPTKTPAQLIESSVNLSLPTTWLSYAPQDEEGGTVAYLFGDANPVVQSQLEIIPAAAVNSSPAIIQKVETEPIESLAEAINGVSSSGVSTTPTEAVHAVTVDGRGCAQMGVAKTEGGTEYTTATILCRSGSTLFFVSSQTQSTAVSQSALDSDVSLLGAGIHWKG